MNTTNLLTPELEKELLEFAQQLIRIKSLSGDEGAAIKFVEQKMIALGYDEVTIDSIGNVLGRMGSGDKSILFDAHADTVEVTDADEWGIPPFSGVVADGYLHGRGSVDMKAAIAASVYAGIIARDAGFTEDKTVYVSCSVDEEFCDGENLKHLFAELDLKPGCVVICEPSDNLISLGHRGKAQLTIKTTGVSAHGSAPEKGVNAIYEMADIIQRVEQLNAELMQAGDSQGTVVMSRISSVSASLNAVPTACEVYLDRRMVLGETEEDVRQEMAQLVAGKNATWAVGTLHRTSWTGLDFTYEPLHPAWQIELGHDFAKACVAAYTEQFGSEPTEYEFWDFSTNAVAPVSLGIPTIGFGPGEYKLAHMRDERCLVSQIIDACSYYARVIEKI